jgi:hypothetical protein
MALERQIALVYKHEQVTPSSTWTIEHNLGIYPIVDAWTVDNGTLQKILAAEVNYVSPNVCELVFTDPIAGFATVV